MPQAMTITTPLRNRIDAMDVGAWTGGAMRAAKSNRKEWPFADGRTRYTEPTTQTFVNSEPDMKRPACCAASRFPFLEWAKCISTIALAPRLVVPLGGL
jgi:hypothetical protein